MIRLKNIVMHPLIIYPLRLCRLIDGDLGNKETCREVDDHAEYDIPCGEENACGYGKVFI
ncbi:MAG: hypothetical protein A4E58_02079 [Syntrophorhabdus sp. PtaB.Bin006]|nr:MAG: hypothetical protein A4E58_02079 [Syntrophorhabdus sp. PtaB.Bin006]